ncbi:MAG: 5'-methylthioadenosine/S-adenosylhomocysteine nucleosidase [Clostridia bacterium]|nr:5'-methylthioadenosine/S-adenosylhomocysteine nucleosidase [Clostridia bacterium]
MKKFGFVIADDQEFAPVEKLACKLGGQVYNAYGDKIAKFTVENNGNAAQMVAIWCGIGKVNSAGGAAALCYAEKVDAIINFGLSGAIKGVRKNDVTIGTKFVEHDFDLTPLGYKPGQKPQETYEYYPDKQLYDMLISAHPELKPCVLVSGDMFVSDTNKKNFVIEQFGGGCCDMESAAIASVCHKLGVPFAAIRSISDDADESAAESYTEVNVLKEDTLVNIVMDAIKNTL